MRVKRAVSHHRADPSELGRDASASGSGLIASSARAGSGLVGPWHFLNFLPEPHGREIVPAHVLELAVHLWALSDGRRNAARAPNGGGCG
jgi:hypothetical protein